MMTMEKERKMMERGTRKERKKRIEKRKKQEGEKEIVLNLFPITFSFSEDFLVLRTEVVKGGRRK